MQRRPPIPLAVGIANPHVMTAIRPVMMVLFSYVIPPVNDLCGEACFELVVKIYCENDENIAFIFMNRGNKTAQMTPEPPVLVQDRHR
jgi:hypothetical protein